MGVCICTTRKTGEGALFSGRRLSVGPSSVGGGGPLGDKAERHRPWSVQMHHFDEKKNGTVDTGFAATSSVVVAVCESHVSAGVQTRTTNAHTERNEIPHRQQKRGFKFQTRKMQLKRSKNVVVRAR